ncbi:hypothetical protein GMB86_00220 [Terrilactibacillus sp. BCM23-1]|uniref:S1 motif domain-containing protein n=1 Tax=Terrilactibacillus tamarindi TaxID=2599694 RepID=A0A6N8CMP9_9BACI|nr:S1-like domain-containing RNA-binding protein [Terrilactibacillus tamarindi]MTT30437.1 hypothetical protein [Terrilactibacillus tamarindi]
MNEFYPGTIIECDVVREAPFGYFLSNGKEEVLLHHNDIEEGTTPSGKIRVFLYQDHQGRLCATMSIPSITLDTYDWAEVVEVKRRLGVFVDIGISKDILISTDDLSEEWSIWPYKGDKLYISLKTDKKDRLFGKLADEETMRAMSAPASDDMFNRDITAYVYRHLMTGTRVITEDRIIGFLHEDERNNQPEPRLGQAIHGRVIEVKEDGTINITLRKRGYEAMDEDARKLYDYMVSRNGAMPFWDKSLPDDIYNKFELSKGAFKRALGKLMKEGKVYQEDGWTYLKKNE